MNEPINKKIPEIIHQMWLDKTTLNNQEPPIKYMADKFTYTWKNKNPSFQYMFWNREMVNILLEHPLLSQWKGFYNKLFYHIEKCDFARYMVIYVYGGIYADLDIECKRPIDDLFGTQNLILLPEIHMHPSFKGKLFRSVFNGIFASQSECPFWLDFLSYIVKHYVPGNNPLQNTGPTVLGQFINDHPEYENCIQYLGPCNATSDIFSGIFGECYEFNNIPHFMVHFSQGTGWQNEVKNKKFNEPIIIVLIVILYFWFLYYICFHKITQYGH